MLVHLSDMASSEELEGLQEPICPTMAIIKWSYLPAML